VTPGFCSPPAEAGFLYARREVREDFTVGVAALVT